MNLTGQGYSVGPGYQVEGGMVLDVSEADDIFYFSIREDRDFSEDNQNRRPESSVTLTRAQARELSDWLASMLDLDST